MYQPNRFTEWHLNDILCHLFTGNTEYMLVFQDADLHHYHFVDKHYPNKYRDERIKSQTIVDRQKFRPDGVLIDRHGRAAVVETKLVISSEKDFASLVFQSLLYANLIISPSYRGKPTCDTYHFLNLLYKAHWFHKKYEGGYRNLMERHQWYFGRNSALMQSEFEKAPKVIFVLPEKADAEKLISAIKAIRELDFDAYKAHIEKKLGADPKNKRVAELRYNWDVLRETQFEKTTFPSIFLRPMNWIYSTV